MTPFPTTPAALRAHHALPGDAAPPPRFFDPRGESTPGAAAAHEHHFRQRVRERYGFTLSPRRYRYWIEKVEEVLPGTEFLHFGERPGRTIWKIRSGSYTLHVVYDETTRRLVTCFPPPFTQLPLKRVRRLRAKHGFMDTIHLARARELAAA